MESHGTVRGKTIELAEPLPFREGVAVTISIRPLAPADGPPRTEAAPVGSPQAVLNALASLPPLQPGDIDALEQAIEEARTPVRYEGVFDDENVQGKA